MDEQTLFLICVVGAVAMIGFFASKFFFTNDEGKLRKRLSNRPAEIIKTGNEKENKAKDLFQKIGQAASKPFMPDTREKMSAMRKKLSRAGMYTPASMKMVTGMKVILLFSGLLGGYLLGAMAGNLMMGLSVGGLFGYMVPTMWLKMQINKQQKALDYGLPDALDLMVVCIEAGLAVDAAMLRVGSELSLAHPRLSKELEITHMETRVGLSRSDALKNLGIRTGNTALQGLTAMLIQAERFGTSIASALRIHGESLRIQRQYKAEEQAAKASVKMSIPLVMFIFPATFIILAGPTVIGLMKSQLFNE